MFLQVLCPHKCLVCGIRGGTELPTQDGTDQKLSAPRDLPGPGGAGRGNMGGPLHGTWRCPAFKSLLLTLPLIFLKESIFPWKLVSAIFFFQLERFMTYNTASPSIPLPGKALPSAKHIKDSRWTRSQFVSWVFSPLTFSVWTHRWLDFLYSPNWWKICRELGWEQLLVSLLRAENP